MTTEVDQEAFKAQGRFWFRGGVSEPILSILDKTARLEGAVGARPDLTEELRDILSKTGGPGGLLTVFGDELTPVRIVAFNKTAETNWAVSWHQDRVIAVAERHDVPGYGAWSRKSGVWHCEPPQEVLDGCTLTTAGRMTGRCASHWGATGLGLYRRQMRGAMPKLCRRRIVAAHVEMCSY